MTEPQTYHERLLRFEKNKNKAEEDYNRCREYFISKGMNETEIDQDQNCGYFKEMIRRWSDKIKELES